MTNIKNYKLNKDSIIFNEKFTLGVATSSYQIEGAYNVDGRLPSIWDKFSKTAEKVKNGDTGDVACEHYHRYKDDVGLIDDLGFDAYRFSIAWPRVLDENGHVNPKGMDFYKRLIEELHRHNIKPFATLYHWDLPQYLEDKGGWLNRETAYIFADYAQKVMVEFGDSLASIVTLNEPWVSAHLGYNLGIHAPGVKCEKSGFCAAHHLLLAHGLGMQAIRAENLKIDAGIVLNMTPSYPSTPDTDDKISAQLDNEFNNDWFIKPILQKSYPYWLQKLKLHAMPEILEGDMDIIAQDIDMLGINYYTRSVVQTGGKSGIESIRLGSVKRTAFDWEVYPQGLTDLLVGLKERYPNIPPIYITENGCAYEDMLKDGSVDDEERRSYYEVHLNAVDNAVKSGVDIKGYFAWSLMDNFEWAEGYNMCFGITHVDFDTQKRTPKYSALAFKALNQDRKK